MIKLIVSTKTDSIFNTFEFTGEGISYQQYITAFQLVDGSYILPDDLTEIEVADFTVTERLPPKYGHRTEFRYDFGANTVYELYIPEVYLIKEDIAKLTKQLTDTDYKVIKSYEASLIGRTVPYDFNQVHAERQAIRDKINELEGLLNSEEV